MEISDFDTEYDPDSLFEVIKSTSKYSDYNYDALVVLLNKLRRNQISLLADISRGNQVKSWQKDENNQSTGQVLEYHENPPEHVAERFIAEYIRYSNLISLDHFKQNIYNHSEANIRKNIIFMNILEWFRQLRKTNSSEEHDISLHHWMMSQEINLKFEFSNIYQQYPLESRQGVISGPVLDMIIIESFRKEALSKTEHIVFEMSMPYLLRNIISGYNYSWLESFLSFSSNIIGGHEAGENI